MNDNMKTIFTKLNEDWNAEPNAPEPKVTVNGDDVIVEFYLNAFQYKQFEEEDKGIIKFKNSRRYRLGKVNDEGWYLGQCRFSKLAPDWGEFYKIDGDILEDKCPNDWIILDKNKIGRSHFLFYFRDEEFECDADDWEFKKKDI